MDPNSVGKAIPPFDWKLYRRLEPIARWVVEDYFDADVKGLDRIPEGPALLVGNHNAGVMIPEGIIFVHKYLQHTQLRDAPVSLGHQLLPRIPLLKDLLRRFSIISASHENAHRAFDDGRKVLVYPGGDWEAMRPSRDRDRVDFAGRTGFIQLAIEAGVPVVPIVAAGAHDGWHVLTRGDKIAQTLKFDRLLRIKVFPIAIAAPTGLVAGPVAVHLPLPHKIIVEALDPIEINGDPDDEALVQRTYDDIVTSMQTKMDELVERLPERRGCPLPKRVLSFSGPR